MIHRPGRLSGISLGDFHNFLGQASCIRLYDAVGGVLERFQVGYSGKSTPRKVIRRGGGMKTLVLANQKGGVGKSAIASQLAFYLNRCGLKVIAVDLDHQQNTSRPLGLNPAVSRAAFTSAELLSGWNDHALPAGDFVLVPASEGLSLLEQAPENHNKFLNNLNNALEAFDRFDVCIIDTNPNPDIRYGAALICADYLLAPIQLNLEAIDGVGALLGYDRYGLTRINGTLNPRLKFIGILPNLLEPTPFQRSNLEQLITSYGSRMLSDGDPVDPAYGFIPKRVAIAEAQAAGVFLPDLKKTSAYDAWREVKPVFDMIVKRMDIRLPAETAA